MNDPNDYEKEIGSILTDKFGHNPLVKFFTAWILSFLVLVATFNLFSGLVPPTIKRVFEYAIPISVVFSLLSVAAGNFTREPRKNAFIFSGVLALLITGISIITYAMPDLVLQEDFNTIQSDVNRLQTTVDRLKEFNLSSSELDRLSEVLTEQGFVTSGDLDEIFGDERLNQEILTVLYENNYVTTKELEAYVTKDEVVAIVQAENTRIASISANATATSIASTCFL